MVNLLHDPVILYSYKSHDLRYSGSGSCTVGLKHQKEDCAVQVHTVQD